MTAPSQSPPLLQWKEIGSKALEVKIPMRRECRAGLWQFERKGAVLF